MKIEKVCVAGMGTMGSQIGIVCATGGYKTIMVEISDEAIERGMANINRFIGGVVKKGKMSEEDGKSITERIEPTKNSREAFAEADVIIEAVFEDIDIKKQIFKQADEVCKENAILASNTSTLSITEMAAVISNPQNFIGTHFLIPAALTPLVEVVMGLQTSDETHDRTIEFLKSCGKDTVTVKDSAGFVINRIYVPMINEAFYALQEGIASAEDIDKACRLGLGFPRGPFEASDASGLDIGIACLESMHKQLGEKFKAAPLMERLVKAGYLGRKTGRGVYDYSKK